MKKIVIIALFFLGTGGTYAQQKSRPISKVYKMVARQQASLPEDITPEMLAWYGDMSNNALSITPRQEKANAAAAWQLLRKIAFNIGEKGIVRSYLPYIYEVQPNDPRWYSYQAYGLYKVREYVLSKEPRLKNIPESPELWRRIALTIVNKDWTPAP